MVIVGVIVKLPEPVFVPVPAAALKNLTAAGCELPAGTVTMLPDRVDMADVLEQSAHGVGTYAVLAIGLGLISYGVYLCVLACWRRMPH